MHLRPVTLEGTLVRLEPLSSEHAPGLLEGCRDPRIWTWLGRGPFQDGWDALSFVRDAQQAFLAGKELAYAIIFEDSVVGSTRFMDVQPAHRTVEIGWTFLRPEVWRTGVNRECKRLLLEHAFTELGALRVTFKTDSRNVRSQRAIEGIGGVREGVLRRHMRAGDGVQRDSVYFSILREEWLERTQHPLPELIAFKA